MQRPVVPKKHEGYVTVLEGQVQTTLDQNNKLEEALRESDFDCHRLTEICNVLLGRLGHGHRIEPIKWPTLFRAIDRSQLRQRGEYQGIE